MCMCVVTSHIMWMTADKAGVITVGKLEENKISWSSSILKV